MFATNTPDPPDAGVLAYTFVKPATPVGSEPCSVTLVTSTMFISPVPVVLKIKFSSVAILLTVLPLICTFPYDKLVAVAWSLPELCGFLTLSQTVVDTFGRGANRYPSDFRT